MKNKMQTTMGKHSTAMNKKSIKGLINELYIVHDIKIILQYAGIIKTRTGETRMKYTQETKDRAVAMVKEGIPFKRIQTELGPNPKAVMRYLAAAGIDYSALREELKAAGKLQTVTKEQGKKPAKGKKAKATGVEETIEE